MRAKPGEQTGQRPQGPSVPADPFSNSCEGTEAEVHLEPSPCGRGLSFAVHADFLQGPGGGVESHFPRVVCIRSDPECQHFSCG